MSTKWNKNRKIDEEATKRILQEEDRVVGDEDWTRNLWLTILVIARGWINDNPLRLKGRG